MSKKRRYLFVINPIAGKGKGLLVQKALHKQKLDKIIEHETIFTKKEEKTDILLQPFLSKKWNGIIVAGGDGTINEVASLLTGKDIPLGIIPMGSGNGLGRHFKIPLYPEAALTTILNGKVIDMDVCCVNNHLFFNTAGIGFDAYVAKLFDVNKTGRGLLNYIKCTIQALFKYKATNYILRMDDKKISTSAFLIEVANASQFGNNAIIAPKASVTDRLMDVTIIQKATLLNIIPLLSALFKGTIHKKKHVLTYKCKELKIDHISDTSIHVDGEVKKAKEKTYFYVFSKKLKILVPQNFEE